MTDIELELANLLDKARFSKRFVNTAYRTLKNLRKEIFDAVNSARAEVAGIQSSIGERVDSFVKSIGSDILIEEIDKAIETAPEFSASVYRESLYAVARKSDMYSAKIIGEHVKARIAMSFFAGDLNDYGNAVAAARRAAHLRDNRDPSVASLRWREKVYGTQLYYKILQTRKSYFLARAPFWRLLNNGNYSSGGSLLSSDIGGTPYPINQPTRFVENAEYVIEQRANDYLYALLNSIEKVNLSISEYQRMLVRLDEVERLISKIETNITKAREIANLFNRRLSEIDPLKYIKGLEDETRKMVYVHRKGSRIFKFGRKRLL